MGNKTIAFLFLLSFSLNVLSQDKTAEEEYLETMKARERMILKAKKAKIEMDLKIKKYKMEKEKMKEEVEQTKGDEQ